MIASKRRLKSANSQAEIAHGRIRLDIIACVLEPGRHLTEIQLAERYGVGRAAVRAALSRLCQERLVQVVPRQGYVVAPITLKLIRDLFDVRRQLEPAVSRLAAERADDAQLEHLARLSEASTRDGQEAPTEHFIRTNTEFHVAVARATGNERLAEMMAGLLDEMERLLRLVVTQLQLRDELYPEHHDLVAALLARDAERAEELSAEQVRVAQKRVMEALLSSPSLQSVNLSAIPDPRRGTRVEPWS